MRHGKGGRNAILAPTSRLRLGDVAARGDVVRQVVRGGRAIGEVTLRFASAEADRLVDLEDVRPVPFVCPSNALRKRQEGSTRCAGKSSRHVGPTPDRGA